MVIKGVSDDTGKEPLFKKTAFLSPKEVLAKLDTFVYGREDTKKNLINFFHGHVESSIRRPLFLGGAANTGKEKLLREFAQAQYIPFVSINLDTYDSSATFSDFLQGQILHQLVEAYTVDDENPGVVHVEKLKDNAHKSILHIDISSILPKKKEHINDESKAFQNVLNEFAKQDVGIVENLTTAEMMKVYSFVSPLLENVLKKRFLGEGVIGFKPSALYPDADTFDEKKVYSYASHEDFLKAGFSPQLIGTVSNVLTMDYFSKHQFMELLTLENSYLNKRLEGLKEKENISVSLSPKAKELLADRLVANGSNAGGIEKTVDTLLCDLYYVKPKKKEITIDESYVRSVFKYS